MGNIVFLYGSKTKIARLGNHKDAFCLFSKIGSKVRIYLNHMDQNCDLLFTQTTYINIMYYLVFIY